MGQLVVRPHAISDKDTQILSYNESKTVAELVRDVDVPYEMLEYIEVFVEGMHIERSTWEEYRPDVGTHVLIAAVAHGGGGKNIFRLIAVIALAFIAPWAAGLILGAGAGVTATLAVTAAISVAGTLAINAIFPPPSLNTDSLSGGGTESPTLSIQGQRNSTRPYGAVTRVYGRHRIWPANLAEPYIQTVGDRDQYLYMLLDLGYGNINVNDIRIGETPIGQYKELGFNIRRDVLDGSTLTRYTKDISTENFSVELKSQQEVIRSTGLADSAQVDFTFPTGLFDLSKKGNKLVRSVILSVEFRKEGEVDWQRFGSIDYDFSRQVRVNSGWGNWGSPYNYGAFLQQLDEGGSNPTSLPTEGDPADGATILFIGSEFGGDDDYDPTYAAGQPNPLIGFPEGSEELVGTISQDIPAASLIWINGTNYTVTSLVPAGPSAIIPISPPLLGDLITVPYEYSQPVGFDNPDSVNAGTGLYTPVPDYTSAGTALTFAPYTFTVSDETTQPFTVMMTMNFPETAVYELRLKRTTADPDLDDSLYGASISTLTAIRSILNQAPFEFDRPHTVMELRVKATDQLNGVISTINMQANARIPVWNGSQFNTVITSSPAWIILDILTGTATPTPIEMDKIDLESFRQFGNFCFQKAPNSDESMFRCDMVVDYQTTVWELAKSVANAARGALIVQDGVYRMTWDVEPTVPIQLITPHNSWGFSGNRTFIDTPDAIRCKFVDPDANWQQKEVIVYADGKDAGNSNKFEDIPLFGVTRSTQAWRDGRYYLAQAILRQETFTISMDLENLVCQRGDYVQLQQDIAKIGGSPARVTGISGQNITASEPFDTNAPGIYSIRMREVNGTSNTLKSYEITNQVDPFTVTVAGGITADIGDLFSYGIVDFVVDDFLVLDVRPGPDLTATITLTNLARPIYSADTGPIPPWSVKIAPDRDVAPPHVTGLKVRQEPINSDGSVNFLYIDRIPYTSVRLFWEKNDSSVTSQYQIYVWRGQSWQLDATVSKNEYYFFKDVPIAGANGQDIVDVAYFFRVLAVGPTGLKQDLDTSPWTAILPIGDITPPREVDFFRVEILQETLLLNWSPNRPWGGPKTNCTINGANELQVIDPTQLAYYYFESVSLLESSFITRIIDNIVGRGEITGGFLSDQWEVVPEFQFASDDGFTMADWLILANIDPLNENEFLWSPWLPFNVRDVAGARFAFRLVIRSLDAGDTTPIIESANMVVSQPGRTSSGSLTTATANVEVFFTNENGDPSPFYLPPNVSLTLQDQDNVDSARVVSVTRFSFIVELVFVGTKTINWIANGHGYQQIAPAATLAIPGTIGATS